MFKFKLFVVSLVLTMSVLLTIIYSGRSQRSRSTAPKLAQIAPNLFVAAQLKPQDLRALREDGIKRIIDFRPDGEAKDQPSSSEMEKASLVNDIDFHYIPVSHEGIPDSAVETLQQVLAQKTAPTVLYCRTGRRAVRTFALVEASFTGQSSDAILEMVRAAGFSADDLREDIARRIVNRKSNTDAR